MELTPIYKRVIGLDVHQAQISACAIIEQADGKLLVHQKQFGAFERDRKALAQWVLSMQPEQVVMQSTGIYWKSPYAALEAVGIIAYVVNARHVKSVPGRKTDVADAQWLAMLARAGLLRASFIPKADVRHLRHIARQRQKLGGMLASEKNRIHKLLTDAGIRLGVVVSDLHGVSARAMVKALIAGKSVTQVLALASARLRVEIGADMGAFGSAQRLSSWVGMCPGNNESAGKRKSGRTRKGNVWVRRLLCEFAQAAARSRCALKDKFKALSVRKGHKRSIVALGHKMLRTIYAMLSKKTHYVDKTVDYEALMVERNVPRWLKMLVKHGFVATPA
jgi:transposase